MDLLAHLRARPHFAGAAGLLLGAALGTAFVIFAGAAVAYRADEPTEPVFDATHLPPLLTTPNERVELRYDVHCTPADETSADAPCDAVGTVFARPGEAGRFRELRLEVDPAAAEGRHRVRVPDDIADSRLGFTYYAVFRHRATGAVLTLPAGGAQAPQRSLVLDRAVEVQLGAHAFGAVRRADARVVEADWGNGPSDVGLEQGRNLPPIGGASFAVGHDGTVSVLDEANKRLLRWRPGVRTPTQLPLAINGALADLELGEDGTIYVLESPTPTVPSPRLRIFGRDGTAEGTAEVAERTATQVRMSPAGPLVLQHPSGQWMPVTLGGRPLPASAQKAAGRAARVLRDGNEVVVLRQGNEVRAALLAPTGVRRAWRLTSDTPLAEVQLAEPLGSQLVLVVRIYEDTRDEFLVLLLGERGFVAKHALESVDWAETAPVSRFRLVGPALYRLGSTPRGLSVDRFDLEVK